MQISSHEASKFTNSLVSHRLKSRRIDCRSRLNERSFPLNHGVLNCLTEGFLQALVYPVDSATSHSITVCSFLKVHMFHASLLLL